MVVMILILPRFSSSLSHFSRFIEIVPTARTTTGITVTFMVHNFSSSRARPRYLFSFSLSFILSLWSSGKAKFTRCSSLFFFWLWLCDGISKSLIILCDNDKYSSLHICQNDKGLIDSKIPSVSSSPSSRTCSYTFSMPVRSLCSLLFQLSLSLSLSLSLFLSPHSVH